MATVMADVAEGVGFEPTDGLPSAVFKTADDAQDALDHAQPPIWDDLQSDGNSDGNGTATLYRYYDDRHDLLYVGRTGRGQVRASAHGRMAPWWPHVATAEFFHGEPDRIVLAERLAIWVERPPYNLASRVSTSQRRAMLAEVEKVDRRQWIDRDTASRILHLSRREIAMAVQLGFLETDFPRALRFTHEQLAAFIGESDEPESSGMPPVRRWRMTPRA